MPEDIGKELLMLGGTLAGFIAALLTVMEKLIDIQHRLGSRKDRKASVQQERQMQDSGPSVDFFSTKPFRGTSYLLMYETGVIVVCRSLAQLCRSHLEPAPGKHPLSRHDRHGARGLSARPVVGSDRGLALQFGHQLAPLSAIGSGRDDFPVVARQHDRCRLSGDGWPDRADFRSTCGRARVPRCRMPGFCTSSASSALPP